MPAHGVAACCKCGNEWRSFGFCGDSCFHASLPPKPQDYGDCPRNMPIETQGQQSGAAAQTTNESALESMLREIRVFPPPAEFAAKAWIGSEAEYERIYRRSVQDPEGFWAEAAGELEWFRAWNKVIEG